MTSSQQYTARQAGLAPQATNGESPATPTPSMVLSAASLETVAGWGRASSAVGHVFRPTSTAEVEDLFQLARRSGRNVGFRGAGKSYGDAALNGENILIDLRRMNRVLEWDAERGIVRVEPGVTLEQLWRHCLPDGWWPPVVTGTMQITLGGGAAMNVHGKNAWKLGPLGEHILEFEHLLPSGEVLTCSADENRDIFYAAIGGFGMLGCFVSLTLQMKRIFSGFLRVDALACRNLREMMDYFEQHLDDSDYLVGWIDAFAGGKGLGRGQLHRAVYLEEGEDANPLKSLRPESQRLSSKMMGIYPKRWAPPILRRLYNNPGWRLVCGAKYVASRLRDGFEGRSYLQPHVHFHFLLDDIPFREAFGPGGIIQYQAFVPATAAHDTFVALLKMQQAAGLPNYLSVLKRHRSDPFLMTHGLDGYSLAMDFHISDRNRRRVARLAREMDALVLAAGGRFYLAKDSTLHPASLQSYLGVDPLAQFQALKARCDPEGLLQTNLWRRLFA